ncbi:acyl carrier protein [Motilimonas sp. E26]|uniref:acyl carrier protein n=1 Tax=Motilimonas sp. E26 TaxID=2865674 RepID=UPI001E3D66DB|nr:acyl carrier protein [Motilimonas sp. E26]MCE0556222.1 acyl carrier protein [Motilimonas sp. E26]
MQQKLVDILSQTLNVSPELITLASDSTNIESWDSLAHMNLIFAIEDSFDIRFTDEQLTNSMSVKQLLEIIS